MTDPEAHITQTAEALRRTLRLLVIATAVLYLVSFAWGIKVYRDGQATEETLCAFRADLITRVVQSAAFLKDHPKGTPDIPAETIISGINNQLRTITSLRGLNCSDIAPVPTPIPTTAATAAANATAGATP